MLHAKSPLYAVGLILGLAWTPWEGSGDPACRYYAVELDFRSLTIVSGGEEADAAFDKEERYWDSPDYHVLEYVGGIELRQYGGPWPNYWELECLDD